MKDIIQQLTEARPHHLDGTGQVDPSTRTSELNGAFAQARETGLRRRRGRLIVPLVAVGAAGAAAVALAVVPGTTPARTGHNEPSPPALSGILLAAQNAETLPTGKYWFTDDVMADSYVVQAKTGDYALSAFGTEEFHWTAAKVGDGDGGASRDLAFRPVSAADRAAWRRAGSPKTLRVRVDDHYDTLRSAPGRWTVWKSKSLGGTSDSSGGTFQLGLTVQQLEKLPTDQEELAKLFRPPRARNCCTGLPMRSRRAPTRSRYWSAWTPARRFASWPRPPCVRRKISASLPTAAPKRAMASSTPATQHWNCTTRQPIGPVGMITPWNTPFMLSTWKIAPALAAGCTVVHKPAEWSPVTADLLAETHEGGRRSRRGAQHRQRHRRGSRQGSDRASRNQGHRLFWRKRHRLAIMAQGAPTLKRVHLELGGKNPVIVFDDADLERALDAVVFMIYCSMASAVPPPAACWCRKASLTISSKSSPRGCGALKVGHPLDPATEIGPLIHAAASR